MNRQFFFSHRARILTAVLCILAVGLSVLLSGCSSPMKADATPTHVPFTLRPDSKGAKGSTPAPTETAAAAAEETPDAPEASPTPVPEDPAKTYLLTFAGDCTLGSNNGATANYMFQGVVGEDYGWPFRLVQDYFGKDTLTVVNLEGTFTTSTAGRDKTFRFKADPKYAACLTEGSVEAVSVANNHSEDFGKEGLEDTLKALKAQGVLAATFQDPAVFTAEDGFKIGIIAGYYPSVAGLQAQYDVCREAGCNIVVAVIHMGDEYYYSPTRGQQNIARACIDMGCSIVVMHHPHVLQPIEYYKEKPIVYSLGNFSFGGNANPRDRDTAIVQLPVHCDDDGNVTLGELIIVPCCLSSSARNNYQPIPLEKDDPAYARVMSKLDGTFQGGPLKSPDPKDAKAKDPTPAPDGTTPVPGTATPAGTNTPAPTATPAPTRTGAPGITQTPTSAVTTAPVTNAPTQSNTPEPSPKPTATETEPVETDAPTAGPTEPSETTEPSATSESSEPDPTPTPTQTSGGEPSGDPSGNEPDPGGAGSNEGDTPDPGSDGDGND